MAYQNISQRAKQNVRDNAPATIEKERKGHMPRLFSLMKKRRELRHSLTFRENFLLDDIEEGTIGRWTRVGEFDLDKLAEGLHVKINKIYVLLKDLESKKIIIRQKTKYKKLELIQLNPEMFGEVLTEYQINHHTQLRIVPNQDFESPEKGFNKSQNRTELVPKKDQILKQDVEIIDKNDSVDSFRPYIDIFRNGKDTKVSLEDGAENVRRIKNMIRLNVVPKVEHL